MAQIKNRIPEGLKINERFPDVTLTHQSRTLEEILGALQKTRDSFFVKEQVYGIAQLYTDGLIENPFQKHMWDEQERVLRNIHQAGIIATGQFYYGQEVDVEQIRDLILPNSQQILRYGSSRGAKSRHLFKGMRETQKIGLEFQKRHKEIGQIDSIVAVASGGFEPAYLIAHILGRNEIVGVRYSNCHRDDIVAKIPSGAPKDYLDGYCKGQNVAIVEDLVCSGTSMQRVAEEVIKHSPKRIIGFVPVGYGSNVYRDAFPGYNKKEYSEAGPSIFELKPKRKLFGGNNKK